MAADHEDELANMAYDLKSKPDYSRLRSPSPGGARSPSPGVKSGSLTISQHALSLDDLSDGQSIWCVVLQAFLYIALYLTAGALFMVFHEGTSWLDGYHFGVVTMTTVGFGHLTPTTEPGRVFVTIYIIVGLHVGAITTGLVGAEIASLSSMRKRAHAKSHARNATLHHSTARHAATALVKHLGFLLLVIVSGATMFIACEGIPVIDAVYFAVETLSTVGYGDIYLDDPDWRLSSELIFLVWLVVGVSCFALSVGKIVADVHDMALGKKIDKMIKGGITAHDIARMSRGHHGWDHHHHKPASGKSDKEALIGADIVEPVSRDRFLVYMLTKLHMVDRAHLKTMNDFFDDLDKDGTGYLTMQDTLTDTGMQAEKTVDTLARVIHWKNKMSRKTKAKAKEALLKNDTA